MTPCTKRGCRNLETICKDCGRVVCKKTFQNGNSWISVKDRLPEEGELVLIHRSGERLSVDYMIDLSPEPPAWACILDDEFAKVTHWMPLPEKPYDC